MSELLEIFSVTYIGGDGASPRGTIAVFDGKRGQIIYRHDRDQRASSTKPSTSQNGEKAVQLRLTGPYRSISAEGCVAMELDLHHHCKDRAPHVAEILIDVYKLPIQHDEAVMKEVPTCTCENGPRAIVRYALLGDAVEASFEVKLPRQHDDHFGYSVCWKIVARYDLMNKTQGEVVLFNKHDVHSDDNTSIVSSHGLMVIPLARSVLAVPSESSVIIDVDLHLPFTGGIVKDRVVCNTDIDSHHGLFCHKGKVEMVITWSD